MPGPDFPTGGILVEDRAAVADAYASGRRRFRLRARWEVEDLGRGQYQVVVTEMPYQVPQARLIERVAELLHARKLPLPRSEEHTSEHQSLMRSSYGVF